MLPTVVALLAVLVLAAEPDGVAPAVGDTPTQVAPAAPTTGAEWVQHFECNRCHEGDNLAEPEPSKACVGCHARIEAGTFEAPDDVLHRWQKNIVDLTAVPSLASIGQRLKRDWVRDFLSKPHDLRPGLSATMPRFAMTDAAATAIAEWLVPDATTADPARWLAWPTRGRRILDTRGCGTCHALGGAAPLQVSAVRVKIEAADLERGVMLAPDLRFVRDRFQRAALVAWLMDPPAQKPGTPMPNLGLSRMDAEDAAAYLIETPLEPVAPKPVPKRLPVLERRVMFKEVSDRVFHRICWHCHSEPDLALGDGGPGNTGGFGFAARHINLRDYASIMAGGLDEAGQRKSLFRKIEGGPLDGTPRILAHLLARQVEESGGEVPGIRGMPLGLPAMSPEDVQLVESWIVQGRAE